MSQTGFTLIVSEKRETAERIAGAIDDNGTPRRCSAHGVPYYEAVRGNQVLRVVPAVGHLYTIAPRGTARSYPVLDVEWVPAYVSDRRLSHTKRWIEAIEELSKGATSFVSATDYDVEGEVIGYTILRFICGGKESEARRMVFSVLTRGELQKAFQDLAPTIDFRLAEAGETRHIVDFIWGINVSRALTDSLRRAGRGFAKLSAGRVQGPTLGFVADREKEINSFVPTPYWRIHGVLNIGGQKYRAEYAKSRIATLGEAQAAMEHCQSRDGEVKSIAERTFDETPPPPFNLGSLQAESYRVFGYTPTQTLRVAEALYLATLISYPRTSSEKIPSTVDCEEILNSLGRAEEYRHLVTELLRAQYLRPLQGKGADPAHPAIYPTGSLPESVLDRRSGGLFDLIVSRFLSSLATPALTQNVRITIDVGGESFFLTGRRILREGWHRFYKHYTRGEENPAPTLQEGDTVTFKEMVCTETYTSPPARFNPGSLLRTMEEQAIGTKATRAGIIDTLNWRGYVSGKTMMATKLGLGVYETLHEYCPVLVAVDFTRDIEQMMEEIREGKKHKADVLREASMRLVEVLNLFKANEPEIGANLAQALHASGSLKMTIGTCPICKDGQLRVIRSRKTGKRFAGCSNYRGACTAAFTLPQPPYKIGTTKKTCRTCSWPTVTVKAPSRSRPWSLCLNPSCTSKAPRNRG